MSTRVRATLAALTSTLSLAALSACGPGMQTQNEGDFPSSPVEIVVPYAAGGSSDTTVRALADEMKDVLGVDVRVINRPGATGATGTAEVAAANADGYTMLMAGASSFASVPLLQDVNYSEDDFQAVQLLPETVYLMVAHRDKFETLEDAEDSGDNLTYGISGTGNLTHVAGASFIQDASLEGNAVPFDSASDIVQSVRGKQSDLGFPDINIGAPQVEQSDELVALAVTSDERLDAMPDVPTFAEAGYENSGGHASRWALSVPVETPDDVVETLRSAVDEALASDPFQEYKDQNFLVDPTTQPADEWFSTWIPESRESVRERFESLNIEMKE